VELECPRCPKIVIIVTLSVKPMSDCRRQAVPISTYTIEARIDLARDFITTEPSPPEVRTTPKVLRWLRLYVLSRPLDHASRSKRLFLTEDSQAMNSGSIARGARGTGDVAPILPCEHRRLIGRPRTLHPFPRRYQAAEVVAGENLSMLTQCLHNAPAPRVWIASTYLSKERTELLDV